MKWASRFLVIFLLVFATLTGIYFARTGVMPWFRTASPTAPLAGSAPEVMVTGLPAGPAMQGSVLEALNRETVGLAHKVLPSVVSITTSRTIRVRLTSQDLLSTFFGSLMGREQVQDRLVEGFGSGVIVSSDGLVVTNHHVIDGMQDIVLLLNDGRQLKANVLASDPVSDVAVLKVDAEGLVPLPIGDSDAVNVGEFVMAVGNPYGLHETVSLGNISAKGRADGSTASDGANQEFLQTDAMINRGHSGGPLVNVHGELIGLNRSIFTDRPNEGWQGIAFAIPANTVKKSLERIMSILKMRSEVESRLGLRLKEEVPRRTRDVLGLGERRGVLVENVEEGSGQGLGGLRDNDFIYSANGEPTETKADLDAQVLKAAADGRDGVELRVLRGRVPLAVRLPLAPPAATPVAEAREGSQQM